MPYSNSATVTDVMASESGDCASSQRSHALVGLARISSETTLVSSAIMCASVAHAALRRVLGVSSSTPPSFANRAWIR